MFGGSATGLPYGTLIIRVQFAEKVSAVTQYSPHHVVNGYVIFDVVCEKKFGKGSGF